MVEPEIAFADLDDLADIAEDFLTDVIAGVLDHCAEDMAFFAERIDEEAVTRLKKLVNIEFVSMKYFEANYFFIASGKISDYPFYLRLDLNTAYVRSVPVYH